MEVNLGLVALEGSNGSVTSNTSYLRVSCNINGCSQWLYSVEAPGALTCLMWPKIFAVTTAKCV